MIDSLLEMDDEEQPFNCPNCLEESLRWTQKGWVCADCQQEVDLRKMHLDRIY